MTWTLHGVPSIQTHWLILEAVIYSLVFEEIQYECYSTWFLKNYFNVDMCVYVYALGP